MVTHYYTDKFTILCGQKHKHEIKATSRFSYKIGENANCKNCEKILKIIFDNQKNKCISFEKLGYNTDCHWRSKTKCNCIDDCAFKIKL